ncbi:unnamed protein product [Lampetra planeri]
MYLFTSLPFPGSPRVDAEFEGFLTFHVDLCRAAGIDAECPVKQHHAMVPLRTFHADVNAFMETAEHVMTASWEERSAASSRAAISS